jgi:hypothetical protein
MLQKGLLTVAGRSPFPFWDKNSFLYFVSQAFGSRKKLVRAEASEPST